MSELEPRFVKKGYWVNLNRGSVMGQTITTDSTTGAIVVALLAVITSLGMTHLWHLLTFFYHQWRANGHPRDGHFRHEQAVLRTLPTPGSMMADFIQLWYAWRGVNTRALRRSLVHISIALVFAAASLVASVFSSSVVANANLEVLVQSPHCGTVDISAGMETLLDQTSYISLVWSIAEEYAQSCYINGTLPSRCNIFSRPKIDFGTAMVPCPFDDKICASTGVEFDSGLIDLNDAFGLNIVNSERIQFRRRTTCSILQQEGYTKVRNDSTGGEGQVVEYLYGTFDPTAWVSGAERENFIFEVSQAELAQTVEFSRKSATSYPDSPNFNQFIPELLQTKGEVTIHMILKKTAYINPVDDILFSAHSPVKLGTLNRTYYRSDDPISAVGCVKQYQYCLGSNRCTKLGNDKDPLSGASPLQKALLELLDTARQHATFQTETLATSQYVIHGAVIHSLPDDQWIHELQFWESYAWAIMQIAITDHAVGPAVRAPPSAKLVKPAEGVEAQLCSMQKMRKQGGFSNINVFGLVFTIVVATTIVLVDLTLLRFLGFLLKYNHGLAPRIDRWVQDGIFQLQRRAHEAQGHGVWKGLKEDVPVTVEKCLLPDLETDTLVNTKSQTPSLCDSSLSDVSSAEDQTGMPKQNGQRLVLQEIPSLRWTMTEGTLIDNGTLLVEATPKEEQTPATDRVQHWQQQQRDVHSWRAEQNQEDHLVSPLEETNGAWRHNS